MLPKRRDRKILVEELDDETLVYDLSRHKAHCLNRIASVVWKHCDGKTSVAELCAELGRSLGNRVDREVVTATLMQLEKAHLLENSGSAKAADSRLSRRELAKKFAVAGLASAVVSVTSPTAAQAASGVKCCSSQSDCPAALRCVGIGHPECAPCLLTNKCCA